jgi:hypothetical protein
VNHNTCVSKFNWGIYDFALLYGGTRFSEHWFFPLQNTGNGTAWILLFSEENPSGLVTKNHVYMVVLIIAVVLSFCVAVKRVSP